MMVDCVNNRRVWKKPVEIVSSGNSIYSVNLDRSVYWGSRLCILNILCTKFEDEGAL